MEYIDLKAQYEYLKEEIDRGVQEVISGAHFIL